MYNQDKMVTLVKQYKFNEAKQHITERCKDPIKLSTRVGRLVGRLVSEDNSPSSIAAAEMFMLTMEKK